VFLPLAVAAFHAARAFVGGRQALAVAVLASLFFYGWWNPPYLFLLGGMIAFNYWMAIRLAQNPSGRRSAAAVSVNLLVLGYFKYRNFFLENAGAVLGHDWSLGAIFVPLGISFYTFEQIALLVDIGDGRAKRPKFLDFVLYVTLFPHLIAGPIVLFRELDHQFEKLRVGGFVGLRLFGPGLVVFTLGLFKKVVIADNLAPYVIVGFGHYHALTMAEAWAAAVGFGLQLYFDFSGYSDMAVGLALMLGFELPINFDTPYRAVSMIDFWKRWHMTMTRFFMMYVYSPIALAWGRSAMNRGMGRWRTFSVAVAAPILVTFLISGLWHGAGWTFVMFGLVNGIGLVTNHAWRQAKLPPLPGVAGWLMTMITVTVSFVYFRAADMTQANDMLAAMVSPSTLAVPNWLSGWADRHALPWAVLGLFSSGAFTAQMAALLAVAAALSVILPNWSKTWSRLVPGARLAVATAAMMYMVGSWLGEPRTFIYFQF
jgi:D-alanyl-lipoteichoic acid acyltransferase DltB (MBOAT superfamily)